MTKTWEDNFDALLAWLDPDRDSAGRKYEEIRRSLILIFQWRGVCDAEDLADETITRVINKVPEIVPGYTGSPALYFYAVAKRLAFEVSRRYQTRVELENPEKLPEPTSEDERNNRESEYECLEKCLKRLSTDDRELILLYYQQEQPKIDHRRELARTYNLVPNALRVKVHRIRAVLHTCINKCLDGNFKLKWIS
jgi:RNA polymerase sigma factor (sigma-70 family)